VHYELSNGIAVAYRASLTLASAWFCILCDVFPVCSVGRLKRQMAEICVKAVLAVADLPRRDVNLDLIKVGILCMCYC
jgi:hypothetical protein